MDLLSAIIFFILIWWIFIRIICWIVCAIINIFTNINIQINYIGILSLGRVSFQLSNKSIVEIGRISFELKALNNSLISPCYLNISNVWVKIDKNNSNNEDTQTEKRVMQKESVCKFIEWVIDILAPYSHFFSLKIYDVVIDFFDKSLNVVHRKHIVSEFLVYSPLCTKSNLKLQCLLHSYQIIIPPPTSFEYDSFATKLVTSLNVSISIDRKIILPPTNISIEVESVTIWKNLQEIELSRLANENKIDSTQEAIDFYEISIFVDQMNFEIKKINLNFIKYPEKKCLQINIDNIKGSNDLQYKNKTLVFSSVCSLKDCSVNFDNTTVLTIGELKHNCNLDKDNILLKPKLLNLICDISLNDSEYWVSMFFNYFSLRRKNKANTGIFLKKSLLIDLSIENVYISLFPKSLTEPGLSLCFQELGGKYSSFRKRADDVFTDESNMKINIYCKLILLRLLESKIDSTDLKLYTRSKHIWGTVFLINAFVGKIINNNSRKEIILRADHQQIEASTIFFKILSEFFLPIQRLLQSPLSINEVEQHDKIPKDIYIIRLNISDIYIFLVASDNGVFNCIKISTVVINHSDPGKAFSCDVVNFFTTYGVQKKNNDTYYFNTVPNDSILEITNFHTKLLYSNYMIIFTIGNEANVNANLSLEKYLSLLYFFQSFQLIIRRMLKTFKTNQSVYKSSIEKPRIKKFDIIFNLVGNGKFNIITSKEHSCCIKLSSLILKHNQLLNTFGVVAKNCGVTFDEKKIIIIHAFAANYYPDSNSLMSQRIEAQEFLEVNCSNSLIVANLETVYINFPYKFDFASCYQDFLNLRKALMKIPNPDRLLINSKPLIDLTVPPDLEIKIDKFNLTIDDDQELEVRLEYNFALMKDEYVEAEKRKILLEERLAEKIDEAEISDSYKTKLRDKLQDINTRSYIDRVRQIHEKCKNDNFVRPLFTWKLENTTLLFMSSKPFCDKKNLRNHLACVEKLSGSKLNIDQDFDMIHGRVIDFNFKKWTFNFRDITMNLLSLTDFSVKGLAFLSEDAIVTEKSVRNITIPLDKPWVDIEITRNLMPIKFHYKLNSTVKQYTMAYGPNWEPMMQFFQQSMNLINAPSVDPSPPLPFWDKIRLYFHGSFALRADEMKWLYHSSFDPLNDTEIMDWTWTNTSCVIDDRLKFKGTLDIYTRTASKYDECQLFHFPNLNFTLIFNWICLSNNPHDHRSVIRVAPNKVDDSLNHDSFKYFRSSNVDVEFLINVTGNMDNDITKSLFWSNTLRWFEKFVNCLKKIAVPVRRGNLFQGYSPRKLQLTRHVRNIKIRASFEKYHLVHWLSSAKSGGFEALTNDLNIDCDVNMTLLSFNSNIIRRPNAVWSVNQISIATSNLNIRLCSKVNHGIAKRVLFLINTLKYAREFNSGEAGDTLDESYKSEEFNSSTNSEKPKQPKHLINVSDVKMVWSVENRQIFMSLLDGYIRANSIKKNLSSDALKLDKNQDKKYDRNRKDASLTLSPKIPSTVEARNSDPFEKILDKLVKDREQQFVAVQEKMSERETIIEDELKGKKAFSMDDLLSIIWHVHVENFQVLLKGLETFGYVLTTAKYVKLITSKHQPVWINNRPNTKTCLHATLECVQYFATTEKVPKPGNEYHIFWLDQNQIHRAFSNVTKNDEGAQSTIGSDSQNSGTLKLERIIERCTCDCYYVTYKPMEDPPSNLQKPTSEDYELEEKDITDTLTILHRELHITASSYQYEIVMDILNNLLLYVEPRRKSLFEKQQNLRFAMEIMNIDPKFQVLTKQDYIRKLLLELRSLEKEFYILIKDKESIEKSTDSPDVESMAGDLHLLEFERKIEATKTMLYAENDNLSTMISYYKELKRKEIKKEEIKKNEMKAMQAKSSHDKLNKKENSSRDVSIARRYEVCFTHAEWGLKDENFKDAIADLTLHAFLYSRIHREDDSGEHKLELGYVHIKSSQPDSIYQDVLKATKLDDDQVVVEPLLRIYCQYDSAVGGIPIKQYFLVNITPLTINISNRFAMRVQQYFFPKKDLTKKKEDELDLLSDLIEIEPLPPGCSNITFDTIERIESSESTLDFERLNAMTTRKKPNKHIKSPVTNDVDTMMQRAEKTNMFTYVKIGELAVKLSYKGSKEKNISDVTDIQLLMPALEYRNKTWAWYDLMTNMKSEYKKYLISQVVRQKLRLKKKFVEPAKEKREEDKVRLLLPYKFGGKKNKKSNNSDSCDTSFSSV